MTLPSGGRSEPSPQECQSLRKAARGEVRLRRLLSAGPVAGPCCFICPTYPGAAAVTPRWPHALTKLLYTSAFICALVCLSLPKALTAPGFFKLSAARARHSAQRGCIPPYFALRLQVVEVSADGVELPSGALLVGAPAGDGRFEGLHLQSLPLISIINL